MARVLPWAQTKAFKTSRTPVLPGASCQASKTSLALAGAPPQVSKTFMALTEGALTDALAPQPAKTLVAPTEGALSTDKGKNPLNIDKTFMSCPEQTKTKSPQGLIMNIKTKTACTPAGIG